MAPFDEINNSKNEITSILEDLNKLAGQEEKNLLGGVLIGEAFFQSICWAFKLPRELWYHLGNLVLLAVVFFILWAIKTRRSELEWLIDKVERNFSLQSPYSRPIFQIILKKYADPFRIIRFFGTRLFRTQMWLKDQAESMLQHYQPSQPVKPSFYKEETITINPFLRFVFACLFLLAFVTTLFEIKERKGDNSSEKSRMTAASPAIVTDSVLYTLALERAQALDPCKSPDLVTITDKTLHELEPEQDSNNGTFYIRVYAAKDSDYFTKQMDKEGFYSTGDRFTWVFTKEEFFRKYRFYAGEDSVYRMKQLLGLTSTVDIKYVACFLVKPSDLFRPCKNTSIASYDPKTTSKGPLASFARDQFTRAYGAVKWNERYPFTQLGYTFDWNPYNYSHVGISEFILNRNCKARLESVMPVKTFLRRV
jgi:hypothetical protein